MAGEAVPDRRADTGRLREVGDLVATETGMMIGTPTDLELTHAADHHHPGDGARHTLAGAGVPADHRRQEVEDHQEEEAAADMGGDGEATATRATAVAAGAEAGIVEEVGVEGMYHGIINPDWSRL